MNALARVRASFAGLLERPRVWMWTALGIAIVSCALLLWLHAVQKAEIDRAIQLMQNLRSARVDLAKGALKIQTPIEGDPGLHIRREGWSLVGQARDRLGESLRESDSVATGSAGLERELQRLHDAYRQEFDAWMTGTGNSLSLMLAQADLERFAEDIDQREREYLTEIQGAIRTEFHSAMAGVVSMLALACSGVFLSAREQSRAAQRTRTAAQAGGVDLWDETLATGEFSWWGGRSGVMDTDSPPATFEALEQRAMDDASRMLIAGIRRAALNGSGNAMGEVCLRTDGGAARWAIMRASCRMDSSGKALALSGALVDVTSRKLEENARTEVELRYRRLSDLVPVGLLHATVDGRIRNMNLRLRQILGYTQSEISPIEKWWPLAYPDSEYRASCIERWKADVAAALAGSGELPRREYAVRTKSGDERLLEITGSAIRTELLLVVNDVTEARRIERNLRESEERFRQMAETIGDVFWMVDSERKQVLYVSPAYERIWGRSCGDLLRHPMTWMDPVVDEDRAKVERFYTDQQNATFSVEYRIRHPGGDLRWIHDSAFPIRDAAGRVVRVVGVARDVTERKIMEERILRSQRMEAVGTLASGVAHDLNNVLAPMLMIGAVLRPKLPDPVDRRLLELAENSARRGAAIVSQLLTFSRGGAGERVHVRIDELVREMAKLAEETFPRNIAVRVEIQPDLPAVLADLNQIHQVLMNLCVNARDAMPDGGVLTLAVRSGVPPAEVLSRNAGARAVTHVVVSVRDSGCGVPEGIRTRIFEPFFTTKELGKGTGLGLSTVLGIAQAHGGFVELSSSPGKGSLFEVHLPAAEQAQQGAVPPASGCPAVPSGHCTILVVDDEEAIRESTAAILEVAGHRVLKAPDGAVGAELLRMNLDAIDLLLSDVMMPCRDGWELAAEARALKPGLPVILASGLDRKLSPERLADLGIAAALGKPFSAGALLETVNRALAAPRITSPGAPGGGS